MMMMMMMMVVVSWGVAGARRRAGRPLGALCERVAASLRRATHLSQRFPVEYREIWKLSSLSLSVSRVVSKGQSREYFGDD